MKRIPAAAYPNALRNMVENLEQFPRGFVGEDDLLASLKQSLTCASNWISAQAPLPVEETGTMVDTFVTPRTQLISACRRGGFTACGNCGRSLYNVDQIKRLGLREVRCSNCGALNDIAAVVG